MEAETDEIEPINYKDEKVFNGDAELILEVLKDVKEDWKKRMAGLDKLQGIVVGNAKLVFPSQFSQFVSKSITGLGTQALDLRSAIARKACSTIELMASELKEHFSVAAERLLSSTYLFKQILNGNKVLAEYGHNAIFAILRQVYSLKLLPKIAIEMKAKNPILRQKGSQYLFCVLTNFPKNILEKQTDTIENLIIQFLNDAAGETRAFGRECYAKYEELFYANAQSLYKRLSPAAQKALLDRLKKAGSTELPSHSQKSPIETMMKKSLGSIICSDHGEENPWKSSPTQTRKPFSPGHSKKATDKMAQTVMNPSSKGHFASPEPEEVKFPGPDAGLGELLKELESKDWEICLSSLEELNKRIQNTRMEEADVRVILKSFIECISHSQYKIVQSALQGICGAIVPCRKQVHSQLDQLVPKLIYAMGEKRESIYYYYGLFPLQ